MNDIVERLRNSCSCNFPDTPCGAEDACRAAFDAAVEIERLRAALGHVDACIVCGQIDQARKAIRAALEGRT